MRGPRHERDEVRMRKDTPLDKWSARQLAAEVRRLRAEAKNPDGETGELRLALERARTREAALLSELAAARAEADAEGIAPDEVAGKPAVAKLRRTWRRFTDAVLRLPTVAAKEGFLAARLVVAKELVPDLVVFEADAPRGDIEARDRDRLRRLLDNPAYVNLLMAPSEWADVARIQFLSQAARAYLRPTVWKLYEHAPDEGVLDRGGTVYK